MSDETRTQRPKRMRRPLGIALLVASATIALGGGTWLTLALNAEPATVTAADRTPSPSPHATTDPQQPATAPDPVTEEDFSDDTADLVLAEYFKAVDAISPEDDAQQLEAVVAGPALDELEAQLLEFESRDWSVSGETDYEDLEVIESDLDAKTPTVTVSVCVDSSDVQLVTADGTPVATELPTARRAVNLYSLEFADGAWRVVGHTFPDDTEC